MLVHYGWAWFPAEHQSQVWNALGAFPRLLWWLGVGWLIGGRLGAILAAWLVCEELMVIGCSVAYIVSPWEIQPGQSQCSSLMQFDIGRIGLLVVVLIVWQAVKPASVQRNKGSG